jgi:hypothetical protein
MLAVLSPLPDASSAIERDDKSHNAAMQATIDFPSTKLRTRVKLTTLTSSDGTGSQSYTYILNFDLSLHSLQYRFGLKSYSTFKKNKAAHSWVGVRPPARHFAWFKCD